MLAHKIFEYFFGGEGDVILCLFSPTMKIHSSTRAVLDSEKKSKYLKISFEERGTPIFITNRGVVYGPEYVILGLIYFEGKRAHHQDGKYHFRDVQDSNKQPHKNTSKHTHLT